MRTRGVCGDLIIKTLESKGGKNLLKLDGNDNESIYFIGKDSIIRVCHNWMSSEEDLYDMITTHGTEIKLPENPDVFTWNDIRHSTGYILDIDRIQLTAVYPNSMRPNKDAFATEQQALSAQAASMISQIRLNGGNIYGNIPYKVDHDNGGVIYAICYYRNEFHVDALDDLEPFGGLLRFQTREQGERFLENNKQLVEQYLKTF